MFLIQPSASPDISDISDISVVIARPVDWRMIVLETDVICDNIFVSLQTSLRRTHALQGGLN